MPPVNELAVDIETATQELANPVNADAVVEGALETSEPDPELSSDVDVENDGFWHDNEDGVSASEEEASPPSDDSDDVPQEQDSDGIIEYKVNGKSVKLDLSSDEDRAKLAKQLSLVDGARKAFSDKNKLRQQLKQERERAEEMNQYKSNWDKLESIKDDRAQLFETITGESWDAMIQNEVEKRRLYDEADPATQRAMEYEERLQRAERERDRERKLRDEQFRKAEEMEYNAEKLGTRTKLEQEFRKYEFKQPNEAANNRLRKMLWRSSLGDIQEYVKQGHEISEKVVRKAFRDNAKALQSFYKTSVSRESKKQIQQQKQDTKQKAEEAATKNFSNNEDLSSLVGKDPMSIFQSFRRGRRK